MINSIFMFVVTIGIIPEVPDNTTAINAFYEQLKRDSTRLCELKENLVAALKEEAEIYLTSIINCISDCHKQIKTYNAVPETTQHNYKRDFKSL